MNKKENWGFTTKCLHGYNSREKNNAHVLPIHATSSFVFETLEESIDVFTAKKEGHVYSRYGNPTVETVAEKIAQLENSTFQDQGWALMTSSGMSAIYITLSTLLNPGDALLCPFQLYGGTTELLLKLFEPKGIQLIQADFNKLEEIDAILSSQTNIKVVYFESPSNPTLQCFDIAKIGSIAKVNQIKIVVDNTFPTPFHQQPLALGADYVIHSTTKYLNGHGNGIAGVIVGTGGEENRYPFWQNMKLTGTNCSPFEAWLVYNGLKTLELRMERHSKNALALASFLEQHNAVQQVHYPGLKSNANHLLASNQMKNGYGGMLSFLLKEKDLKAASKCINQLNLATQAPTLGDVDTLVMHPYTSSHLKVSEKQKLREGVDVNLIRVSVGIENIEDLVNDFDQALQ
jgi:methionine-gamma-lyase